MAPTHAKVVAAKELASKNMSPAVTPYTMVIHHMIVFAMRRFMTAIIRAVYGRRYPAVG
jgi:hypothetical protein